MSTPLVVAVDGPSGSGKSSTARGVARTLGLAYLDTGAMYRAMTWALLQRGTDLEDADAVTRAAATVTLVSGTDPDGPSIEADGTDVSGPIRTAEVTSNVSVVSAVPAVREMLVARQREAIVEAGSRIVVEGRDIGTVVAPDADLKVFLVADPEARAARRAAEQGDADAAATLTALAERDALDSSRTASPLAKADDAVLVDGTHLGLDEVVEQVVTLVREVRP